MKISKLMIPLICMASGTTFAVPLQNIQENLAHRTTTGLIGLKNDPERTSCSADKTTGFCMESKMPMSEWQEWIQRYFENPYLNTFQFSLLSNKGNDSSWNFVAGHSSGLKYVVQLKKVANGTRVLFQAQYDQNTSIPDFKIVNIKSNNNQEKNLDSKKVNLKYYFQQPAYRFNKMYYLSDGNSIFATNSLTEKPKYEVNLDQNYYSAFVYSESTGIIASKQETISTQKLVVLDPDLQIQRTSQQVFAAFQKLSLSKDKKFILGSNPSIMAAGTYIFDANTLQAIRVIPKVGMRESYVWSAQGIMFYAEKMKTQSSDGKTIPLKNLLMAFDLQTGKVKVAREYPENMSLNASSDHRYVTATTKGYMELLDTQNLTGFRILMKNIGQTAFSANNRVLAFEHQVNKKIFFFDLQTKKMLPYTLKSEGPLENLFWTPDGDLVTEDLLFTVKPNLLAAVLK